MAMQHETSNAYSDFCTTPITDLRISILLYYSVRSTTHSNYHPEHFAHNYSKENKKLARGIYISLMMNMDRPRGQIFVMRS